MAKQKLKLGFIGGGVNSAIGKTHQSATAIDSLFEVTCGKFSRDKLINEKTAYHLGLNKKRAYHNISEMISKEELDAVVIMTPTPDHLNTIEKLSNKGITIICEKPIVTSIDEWCFLNNSLNNKNDLIGIYNYTGYPMVREAQRIIESGKLGKVIQVLVEMPNEGLTRPPKIAGKKSPPQSWRLEDGLIPQATLDLTTHSIQLFRFITKEEISSAQGQFSNHSKFKNVQDTTQIIGRLTNDASFSIWTSKSALGERNGLQIRVFLDKGSLQWVQSDAEKLFLTNSRGKSFVLDRSDATFEAHKQRYDRFKVGHPAGFIEAFANYYYDIYQYIRNGKSNTVNSFLFNLDDSFEELVVLENLVISGKYDREENYGRFQKLRLAIS